MPKTGVVELFLLAFNDQLTSAQQYTRFTDRSRNQNFHLNVVIMFPRLELLSRKNVYNFFNKPSNLIYHILVLEEPVYF